MFFDKKPVDKFIQKTNQEMQDERLRNENEAHMRQLHEQEEREQLTRDYLFRQSLCEKLDKYLDEENIRNSQATSKDEIVHMDRYGFTFDSEGFSFNYIMVSLPDIDKDVTVEYKGITYKQTLTTGINEFNVPSGAVLKAEDLDVVIIKSNLKLK